MTVARSLLTQAHCVLFDFDGPLCRLFPADSSRPLADELRCLVADFGFLCLLAEEERTSKDPHMVLRAIHRARREADLDAVGAKDDDLAALLERLEQRLTAGEAAAALKAEPPPSDTGVFVRGLAERGLRLAVVTNNSPHVAESYLREHGLYQYFKKAVHGRTDDPGLMKPHPDVLQRALRDLDLRPENAVMIGDTDTDLLAADRAGVGFIGYDTAPLARARLRHAGAKVVLGAYAPLLGEARRDGGGEGVGAYEPGAGFAGEAAR